MRPPAGLALEAGGRSFPPPPFGQNNPVTDLMFATFVLISR